jgi:hypothetical protein
LAVFFFVTVVVSSLVVLVGAGVSVVRWFDETFRWRDAEYSHLAELRAGFTLSEFEHVLGTPLFARPASSHLTESTFRGRDYWVQAISDAGGTVIVYAVTSCDASFTPSFTLPLSGDTRGKITLNRTRPAFALPQRDVKRVRVNYFTGITTDQYYFDEYYGANAGFYKSYAWGVDDACPNWYSDQTRLVARHLMPGDHQLSYRGYAEDGGPSIARFRSHVPVNTYAETAVGALGFPKLKTGLHIGVDRILIRTATLTGS